MKIILFTRRNVGLYCLSMLVALGHKVSVVTDDDDIEWLAERLRCKLITMETMGDYDFLISVHWHKVIPIEYLKPKQAFNIHPCLFKYKGANPIKRYIKNRDTKGTVESHWMQEKPDEGEAIHQQFFTTPLCINYSDFYNIALKHYFFCLDATLNKIIQ